MHLRQCGQRHPPGRAEVQLAGVKQGHKLGELFGVGTEEEIDSPYAAGLVGRSGHPHGGVDQHAAVPDHAGAIGAKLSTTSTGSDSSGIPGPWISSAPAVLACSELSAPVVAITYAPAFLASCTA